VNNEMAALLKRLEELKRMDELVPVHRIGSGPYGIQAVFSDGSRHLKCYGFADVGDARIYKAFAESIEVPDDEQMRAVAKLRGIEVRPKTEREEWLRFEIVKISEVLDVLEMPPL
jgi:hypothetical protein